jgi:hypothetical protein
MIAAKITETESRPHGEASPESFSSDRGGRRRFTDQDIIVNIKN